MAPPLYIYIIELISNHPTGTKTDEELWTALEIALVKDAVSDMPDGLDTKIVDEGEQFVITFAI